MTTFPLGWDQDQQDTTDVNTIAADLNLDVQNLLAGIGADLNSQTASIQQDLESLWSQLNGALSRQADGIGDAVAKNLAPIEQDLFNQLADIISNGIQHNIPVQSPEDLNSSTPTPTNCVPCPCSPNGVSSTLNLSWNEGSIATDNATLTYNSSSQTWQGTDGQGNVWSLSCVSQNVASPIFQLLVSPGIATAQPQPQPTPPSPPASGVAPAPAPSGTIFIAPQIGGLIG